ncbi:hypothetical protein LIER_27319 [Lithospermum erythrorhizon]|uniref:Retrotransposon Copia-like N-terminal domain-containing protein n=1 Tax=Lithospermum erythrorhizon TaxID=34254 RepID=A0AAV3RDL2_LITER
MSDNTQNNTQKSPHLDQNQNRNQTQNEELSSQIKVDNPLFLHSSDHSSLVLVTDPLNEYNYTSWSRLMIIALEARDKFDSSYKRLMFQVKLILHISSGGRNQILSMDPLPNVSKAFSMVAKVEQQSERVVSSLVLRQNGLSNQITKQIHKLGGSIGGDRVSNPLKSIPIDAGIEQGHDGHIQLTSLTDDARLGLSIKDDDAIGGVNSPEFLANLSLDHEPYSFKQAQQSVEWVAAMDQEIQALENNNTWEITYLPAGVKSIGCKWPVRYEALRHLLLFSGNLPGYGCKRVGHSQKDCPESTSVALGQAGPGVVPSDVGCSYLSGHFAAASGSRFAVLADHATDNPDISGLNVPNQGNAMNAPEDIILHNSARSYFDCSGTFRVDDNYFLNPGCSYKLVSDKHLEVMSPKSKLKHQIAVRGVEERVVFRDPVEMQEKSNEGLPKVVSINLDVLILGIDMLINSSGNGNRDPCAIRALKDLIEKYSLSVVFLTETKTSRIETEKVIGELGFSGSFIVDPVENSGGVWLLWDENRINVEVRGHDKHYFRAPALAPVPVENLEDSWLLDVFGGDKWYNNNTNTNMSQYI